MRSAESNSIRKLIGAGGRVHLVGICGVGMAGLAYLLRARGLKVSGCDLSSGRMADWLRGAGIAVLEGHSADHITADTDWVIRTAAVAPDAPEIVRAVELGIPVFKRGLVLPEVLSDSVSVAVGGTHGKTTTTTFIAHLLKHAGRDPSWCIGGDSVSPGGVAGAGKGGVVVAEADESDGTIAFYEPDIAVVTNIEFDHMEHFASVEAFEDCFRKLVAGTKRRVVYCGDDRRAAAICGPAGNSVSYGFAADSVYSCSGVEEGAGNISFTLTRAGCRLGRLELPVPGRHNILNAMAAAAAGFELGLSFEELRSAFACAGLPRRRFERIPAVNGIQVISDYAHHPSEIAAFLSTAARLEHKRLLAVYQPHRYTRTLALGKDFPASFKGLDKLVLTPVYAASEAPLRGGTTWDLYRETREQLPEAEVYVATSLEQAWGYFRNELKDGDVFLVTGAGSVERIAGWAKDMQKPAVLTGGLNLKFNEPLANRTTLKVGGSADVWAEVNDLSQLEELIRQAGAAGMPFRIMGAGSNVVVSDLGLRGITVRLSGGRFGAISEQDGIAVAGAGVPLARLAGWAEENQRAGLEFLEGIPGTVGGALMMNAGAHGGAICDRVSWVKCLNGDGAAVVLRKSDLKAGYRCAPGLRGMIVLEAGFDLDKGSQETIKNRRKEISQKRSWLTGLRSAGSVFKNPDGDHAGRLIEAAGFKGFCVGGARVFEGHANVIVTGAGARASDVLALIEIVRAGVHAASGVMLESEVIILE